MKLGMLLVPAVFALAVPVGLTSESAASRTAQQPDEPTVLHSPRPGAVTFLGFFSDGQLLSATPNSVAVWPTANGKPSVTVFDSAINPASKAFSAQLSLVALNRRNQMGSDEVLLWNVESGRANMLDVGVSPFAD